MKPAIPILGKQVLTCFPKMIQRTWILSGLGFFVMMKRANLFWAVCLAVSVLSVLALNYWALPVHDEMCFSLEGFSTPVDGVAHHVETFSDIVRIQINDYFHGPSGRVFLHGVVALFAGFHLSTLFDFLNTFVWFAFAWPVLTNGQHARKNRAPPCVQGAEMIYFNSKRSRPSKCVQ